MHCTLPIGSTRDDHGVRRRRTLQAADGGDAQIGDLDASLRARMSVLPVVGFVERASNTGHVHRVARNSDRQHIFLALIAKVAIALEDHRIGGDAFLCEIAAPFRF